MTVNTFHMICDDFNTYVNSSHKINNKREQNRVVLFSTSIDDSMPEYCRCEAEGYHTICPYMNKCHCEDFSLLF